MNKNTISNFNDKYSFLNNEYKCEVMCEKIIYPTVIHAYYASLTNHDYLKKRIKDSKNLEEINKHSLSIETNFDENKKLILMESLLRDKFIRNKNLKDKLADTNNNILINQFTINSKNNLFWGVVNNIGENNIGKILMKIRKSIIENEDLDIWLLFNKQIENNEKFLINVKIKIYKNNKLFDKIKVKGKNYYIFNLINFNINLDYEINFALINKIEGVFLVNTNLNNSLYLNKNNLSNYNEEIWNIENKIYYKELKIKILVDYYETKDKIKDIYYYLKKDIKIIEDKINNKNEFVDKTVLVSGYKNINIRESYILEFFNKFGKIKDLKVNRDYRNKKILIYIIFKEEKSYIDILNTKHLKHNNDLIFIKKATKNEYNIFKRKRSYD